MLDINTIVYKLPIEVDSTRLLADLDNLVLPYFNQDVRGNLKSIRAANVSITGLRNLPLETCYNTEYNRSMTKMIDLDTNQELTKHFSTLTLGFPGPWRDNLDARYNDNVSDRNFIYWNQNLKSSEIFNLNNRIAKFLKISDQMRCRATFMQGYQRLNFHADPHTPWRVHVNLKSGPGTKWFFRTLDPFKFIEWVQPPNSVWLIRTGNVQHAVLVPEDEIRWQLYYHIWQSNLGPDYHQIA